MNDKVLVRVYGFDQAIDVYVYDRGIGWTRAGVKDKYPNPGTLLIPPEVARLPEVQAWAYAHTGKSLFFVKKLTNEQQADLPLEGWLNQKTDSRYYFATFIESWEVDADTYQQFHDQGALCQQLEDGRYIVTDG